MSLLDQFGADAIKQQEIQRPHPDKSIIEKTEKASAQTKGIQAEIVGAVIGIVVVRFLGGIAAIIIGSLFCFGFLRAIATDISQLTKKGSTEDDARKRKLHLAHLIVTLILLPFLVAFFMYILAP